MKICQNENWIIAFIRKFTSEKNTGSKIIDDFEILSRDPLEIVTCCGPACRINFYLQNLEFTELLAVHFVELHCSLHY